MLSAAQPALVGAPELLGDGWGVLIAGLFAGWPAWLEQRASWPPILWQGAQGGCSHM
jgi:hypothetical protein